MQLPNRCSVSEIKVYPSNWNKRGASTDTDWIIQYTFYDPDYEKGKRRQIRGMNDVKDLAGRRERIKDIIRDEIELLQSGYNPIREAIITPVGNFDITPDTPFIKALWKAKERVKGVNGTLIDIGSTIRGLEKSAKQLGYDKLPIKKISQKYYVRLFEQCAINNPRFSKARQNKYVAWLRKLYKVLKKMEAVEINPLADFEREETMAKERRLPTEEERQQINDHLFKCHYTFWRAIQLFFHSGSRETEFMALQAKDINPKTGYGRYTVLKGKSRNVDRPIKDSVLGLWKEIISEAKSPEDYLFSKFLKPGVKKIRTDQLLRRWQKYVKAPVNEKNPEKGGLGIDIDLYTLKHMNTTAVMDELDKTYNYDPADDVKELTAHTTTAMIVSIYDKNYDKRKHSRIKKVNNTF